MAEIGRPTVMTPETIAKLEEAFLMALNDREACLFSNIAPSTLYAYCQENREFSERKELLKEQVKIKAKRNIADAIDAKNVSLSKWYLERKAKDEFSSKQEVEQVGEFNIKFDG